MAPKSIAVVICSVRPGRINPFVAQYVLDAMAAAAQQQQTTDALASGAVRLEMLDLAAQGLALSSSSSSSEDDDAGIIPASLPAADPTPHYGGARARAWSATVRRHDAFVFVTPQYNWSVPAALKHALDVLFHEWAARPAAVVSYGGRGGGKAAAHLRQVLAGGLHMDVVPEPAVELKIVWPKAPEEGGAAGAEAAMRELWGRQGEEDKIAALFGNLFLKLMMPPVKP
ncbi:flavoprotein-like protein [Xylariaceae sp. FL0804]|nr:flavoprotein-like protein [Xylariaceae sp. FL0804]